MKISPKEFINLIKEGKTEKELNTNEDAYISPSEVKSLIRHGHTYKSAINHLKTDYSNGYTICNKCGSFYQLGKGFTKHLSDGCLNCEGETKHKIYYVDASKPSEGGFKARHMSVLFNDGMHYCKDKLQINKYKHLI